MEIKGENDNDAQYEEYDEYLMRIANKVIVNDSEEERRQAVERRSARRSNHDRRKLSQETRINILGAIKIEKLVYFKRKK